MNFIWNAAPGYKGTQLQPARVGLLAGFGSMLGGVTPVYKSVGSARAHHGDGARHRARGL